MLFALTAVPAAFFFALHLGTGEAVPLTRARALYRWAVVAFLGTFDIAIFTKVIQGLIAIW